jgi:hypothetical protein
MDIWYMCLFCVCVVLCLGRGLATSWSLVQGVLPSVKWSWNWKKSEARAQGGCRASEKKIDDEYKLLNSSLRSFLQSPAISSVLGTPCSRTHTLYVLPLIWEAKFWHPYMTTPKLPFYLLTLFLYFQDHS